MSALKSCTFSSELIHDKVTSDIERYLKGKENNSVLLFPPLNSYLRFLIHNTIEKIYSNNGLVSFSIGDEERRRVVVFRKEASLNSSFPHPEIAMENKEQPVAIKRRTIEAHYVPPPARKGNPQNDENVRERMRIPKPKIDIKDSTKACNDSSLLFQGDQGEKPQSSSRGHKKTRYKYNKPKKNTLKETDRINSEIEVKHEGYSLLDNCSNEAPSRSKLKFTNAEELKRVPSIPAAALNLGESLQKKETENPRETQTDKKKCLGSSPLEKKLVLTLGEYHEYVENQEDKVSCMTPNEEDKPSYLPLKTPPETQLVLTLSEYNDVHEADVEETRKVPQSAKEYKNDELVASRIQRRKKEVLPLIPPEKQLVLTLGDYRAFPDAEESDKVPEKLNKDEEKTKPIVKKNKNKKPVQSTPAPDKMLTRDKVTTSTPPLSVEVEDWESLYDNLGDNELTTKEMDEITDRVGRTRILRANEYYGEEIASDDCSSTIIEIYGFNEEIKTSDLIAIFGSYASRGFNLKWVDDTHALGIFASPRLAEEVLNTDLPMIKTRPLHRASSQSQSKAKSLVLPSALRPKTCSALARRLVSGALGLKVSVSPEQRAAERELLRQARENKKQAAKDREAAWEGNFPSTTWSSLPVRFPLSQTREATALRQRTLEARPHLLHSQFYDD